MLVLRRKKVFNYSNHLKPIKLDCGFYIGETDNFHWIFEFLPKVLCSLRLFLKQDIPLFVGKNFPIDGRFSYRSRSGF